jgi:SHS2 domain-containing protein
MTAKSFEIIDHTADIGIVAYGSDIKELFSNAALALVSLVTDIEGVREDFEREVKIESQDEGGLLVDWLNELIYLLDTEHTVFRRFDITSLAPGCLEATCYGEAIDPQRHTMRMEVKAATYHMLKIDMDEDNGYRVRVILDV